MSKNLIIGIVAAIVLAGGAIYVFQRPGAVSPAPVVQNSQPSPTAPTQNQPKPSTTKPTGTTQGAKPVAPAQIVSAQMSTALAANGTALKPSTVFSPTTPTLYAVLTLKNAKQLTQLSYIRYYEGKYVDSKVSHPSKDGAVYFHFDWALNAGKTRKVGNYSLVFYVDGKKAQTVNYSIR